MTNSDILRRFVAELIGTLMLLTTVVGSGIMAERLAGGNIAVALLANTIATGAALVCLLLTFGPISGGHFNPAVTVCDAFSDGITWKDALDHCSLPRARYPGHHKLCDVQLVN